MKHWKTINNRKKIQRHVNKVLRDINKSIERDDLWLGRFYCKQENICYYWSEDHTDLNFTLMVSFTDRKTGRVMVSYYHRGQLMGTAWRVWQDMNDFIVYHVQVWQEDPRPSLDNVWDYRKEGKK